MINIQTILNLYFFQKKTRQRIINIFCCLKLCIFLKILKIRMKTLMSHAKIKIDVINQQFFKIFTYDNFNFAKKKRNKKIDENRIIKFIITSLMFVKRNFENELLI